MFKRRSQFFRVDGETQAKVRTFAAALPAVIEEVTADLGRYRPLVCRAWDLDALYLAANLSAVVPREVMAYEAAVVDLALRCEVSLLPAGRQTRGSTGPRGVPPARLVGVVALSGNLNTADTSQMSDLAQAWLRDGGPVALRAGSAVIDVVGPLPPIVDALFPTMTSMAVESNDRGAVIAPAERLTLYLRADAEYRRDLELAAQSLVDALQSWQGDSLFRLVSTAELPTPDAHTVVDLEAGDPPHGRSGGLDGLDFLWQSDGEREGWLGSVEDWWTLAGTQDMRSAAQRGRAYRRPEPWSPKT